MRKPSQVWVAPCMRSSRLSCSGSEEGGGGTSGGTAGRGGGPAAAGRAGVGTGPGARVGAEACGGAGGGAAACARFSSDRLNHSGRPPSGGGREREGRTVPSAKTIGAPEGRASPGGLVSAVTRGTTQP